MSPRLLTYLRLESMMLELESDAVLYDTVTAAMDTIWLLLTDDEHDLLSERGEM